MVMDKLAKRLETAQEAREAYGYAIHCLLAYQPMAKQPEEVLCLIQRLAEEAAVENANLRYLILNGGEL
jgi:hypothetical protein